MAGSFLPLTEAERVAELLGRSETEPVILFLHDPGCPTSLWAHQAMTQFLQVAGYDVWLVNVQRGQAISRAIAEQTGVRHESPQALVLRHGRATWHASHGAVTTDRVTQALRAADADSRKAIPS